jgi:hypothetical protein
MQDLDLIKKGREFEREHIITTLRAQALTVMKRNPQYCLNIGFVIETIRDMPDAWEAK